MWSCKPTGTEHTNKMSIMIKSQVWLQCVCKSFLDGLFCNTRKYFEVFWSRLVLNEYFQQWPASYLNVLSLRGHSPSATGCSIFGRCGMGTLCGCFRVPCMLGAAGNTEAVLQPWAQTGSCWAWTISLSRQPFAKAWSTQFAIGSLWHLLCISLERLYVKVCARTVGCEPEWVNSSKGHWDGSLCGAELKIQSVTHIQEKRELKPLSCNCLTPFASEPQKLYAHFNNVVVWVRTSLCTILLLTLVIKHSALYL